jgi:hypothetical protein
VHKYYFQVTPKDDACYQVPSASGGVSSYRTICSGEENEGVGHPTNIWYSDEMCQEETGTNTTVDDCIHPLETHEEIYGGARVYHSRNLPRAPSGATVQHICFANDAEYGAELHAKLAPWNTYKDVIVPDGDNNDGDYGFTCQGGSCQCNGARCRMQLGGECDDGGCVCLGEDCTCPNGNCGTVTDMTTHTCMGSDCQCTGDSCAFIGYLTGTDSACDPTNEMHCHCYGGNCGCHANSGIHDCICVGPDCGCNAGYTAGTTCNLDSTLSCVGDGCSCPQGSNDDCSLLGWNSHCTNDQCGCYGNDCQHNSN